MSRTKVKTCYQSELEIPWGPIKLEQAGVDNFRVTYGKQVDANLDYGEAAAKLGQAIMHWLACEGQLDNREKGERY
jgi:hypothetical protein